VDHLGLGTMAGTYLFGPLDHMHPEDVRESVHDVGGLQILTGTGEWLWRPVANRATLQISGFADHNPRGFGMLQRNRNFDAYDDDISHWELRPSLWIEPIGDWGDGELQLLEIPNDSEANDNIIALWRPKGGIPEGGSASFAYRQFWCWTPPARPEMATAITSRMGKVEKRLRFVIEFVGDAFADAKRAEDATVSIEASPGQVTSIKLFPSAERKSVRVDFDIDPGSNLYSELRVLLKAADKPVSETWLYRWTA
jgi:glucans biosynthesis protein